MTESEGDRRADLMHAEQLLLKIGDCLHEVDPERFQTKTAGHLNSLLDRVCYEIKRLPRPN